MSITEAEKLELTGSVDLRDVIVEKSKRQKMARSGGDDALIATQLALKEVTEEMEKMREKMDALENGGLVRYALGYDPVEFNKLKYTESLQWVSTNLVVAMKQEMENHPEYFRFAKQIGSVAEIGNRACAGFNRGSSCRKKWHTFYHQTHRGGAEELRLHCCVLCMEAIGVLSGHPLIDCPWIKAETWNSILG